MNAHQHPVPAGTKVITHMSKASWVREAKALQRKGLTFTEIATLLRMPRQTVVDRLYWDVVR